MSGRVTVITPVFNEQDSLPLYVEAARRVLFARSDVMGLIGEYLYRTYLEAMQRPLYVVADRCGPSEPDEKLQADDVIPRDLRKHVTGA